MLNFYIRFGQYKNSSEVCFIKNKKNEFNYLLLPSHDVGNFRRGQYCIILSFLKYNNQNLCKPQGFFYSRFQEIKRIAIN